DIYISVLNYTIKLNLDTISSTVEEITRKFGMELPKMETPQISLEEILNLVASFKLNSSSLEIDLSSIVEMIGVVGVSFSLDNSTLNLEANSSLAQLSANISPIEYKEIAAPNQYYDEKDILKIMDYVEDVMKLLNNKHGYISFSGSYKGIEVLGSLYVDWKDLVQAKGTITIGYEGETLTLGIFYSNDTVYLAYENIKVKLSKTTLTSLIRDKLSSFPAIEIEEILTQVKEVVKEISITDSKLSVFLNLGAIIDGMTETEFVLTNTKEGFNLSSSLYDFNLCLDVTKIEEIQINDDEYSSIEGYLDLMEYFISNLYKESLGIKLNGEMIFDTYTIGVLGEIDLYLKDNAYTVDGKFTVTYLEHQVEVGIIVSNKDVYVSLLGYTIKLNLNTISETILEITRKLGIELPKMETPQIDFKDIIHLLSKIKLDSNSIEADLSSVFEFIGIVGI
ncbi:MAG: hypothetical protein K2M84_01700, partial [Anaeroplasmataceae bacterium]|nr:hypothetical protein [Anaeroplasmataceae bacterium]